LLEVEATASQIRSLGQRGIALRANVYNPDDVSLVVNGAVRDFGKIDILVNNAGIQGPIGLLVDNDIDAWIETIYVYLVGAFLCCKAVLPYMIERRQGKIINLSGGGAAMPRPRFSAYAACKAGVVRLTETLAEELKRYNIQVNAIAPGAINTRMQDQILAAGEAAGLEALSEAKRCKETGGVPPEKAAALVVFLASEASDGLTGKLISAVHDRWTEWTNRVAGLSTSPWYTLRRIDSFTLRSLMGEWPIE
jgi:NAD(P)-dependent dehydrogenase (short-subunit alcohol dehydrogenase family)